ncbi:MAG: type II toxin-antitoxin system HicB family antitoxin [Clostridiales bacterium]|nr:type II toxin-antitoxin system HicB family antitoxin [Clostridiales bacterium]
MKYVYPAIFTKEEKGYSILFPDFEGCFTCGDTLEDGIMMAEDVLAFTLYAYERDNKEIPLPSNHTQLTVAANEFVNYIACDTIEYRRKYNTKAVKKTLSIPEWLNEAATRAGINCSAVLQEALKEKLGY